MPLKIILTGSTGFIGRAVLAELQAHGHEVHCLNLRGQPNYPVKPHDALVHCAWDGVRHALRDNWARQTGNLKMIGDVLENAMAGVKRVVALGSQAELYPGGSAYSSCKRAALDLLTDYAKRHGIERVCLRLFSVYGPGDGEDWLIPNAIRKLRAGEPLEMTPGDQDMDYTHVSDIAVAVRLALDPHIYQGVYQVGTGNPVKLRTVVEILDRLTGSKSELRFGALGYRQGQLMRACAEPGVFKRLTGWQPKVSLEDGLKGLVEDGVIPRTTKERTIMERVQAARLEFLKSHMERPSKVTINSGHGLALMGWMKSEFIKHPFLFPGHPLDVFCSFAAFKSEPFRLLGLDVCYDESVREPTVT